MRRCSKGNTLPTKEDVDRWGSTLDHVSCAEHEPLFKVMTAQRKGWQLAKELDFYKSGMFYPTFGLLTAQTFCVTCDWLYIFFLQFLDVLAKNNFPGHWR